MGVFSRGVATALLLAPLLCASLTTSEARTRATLSHNDNGSEGRVKRAPESLLTVEWEGIQTGDHPESDVKGFLVEYRPEMEKMWQVHSGIIPYKGPNHQYRVQIAKLPTGTAYFVRIKVLGSNNEIIVETPEIRARNEIVSIKCDSDDLTAPRVPIVMSKSHFSIALSWEAPECGSVGEYQVELIGVDAPFDLHRQTVTQPSVSITNLLPGTLYNFRVRAADRNRQFGPWSELVAASTDGHKTAEINDMRVVYKSDSEIEIEWSPLEHERLQNYEVMLVETGAETGEVTRVERVRLPAGTTSFILSTLKPNTKCHIKDRSNRHFMEELRIGERGEKIWIKLDSL